MGSQTRFVVGFGVAAALVFLVSAVLMHTVVPAAEAWSASNCVSTQADGCTVVTGFLKWWWAALLILVVPVTFFATRELMGKMGR